MFTRADRLGQEEGGHDTKKYHVLSFEWDNYTPRLHGHDPETGRNTEINLWEVNYEISYSSTCAGSWKDGQHIPCPDQNRVTGFSICPECAKAFIPVLDCIFEPRCNGELCGEVKFCKRDHVVYLSFQGMLAKIGMTSAERIRQRQIEQGSDAYSVLARTEGRKAARELEKELSQKLFLRQKVRTLEQLNFMTQEINPEFIERKFKALANNLKSSNIMPSPLTFLDQYPITLPLEKAPKQAKISGKHHGQAIGIKGKYLLYSSQGQGPENHKIKALTLDKLPGRYLTLMF